VLNLQHLNECCSTKLVAVNTNTISHPQAEFMRRAIELSRIAGLEKRTGAPPPGCIEVVFTHFSGRTPDQRRTNRQIQGLTRPHPTTPKNRWLLRRRGRQGRRDRGRGLQQRGQPQRSHLVSGRALILPGALGRGSALLQQRFGAHQGLVVELVCKWCMMQARPGACWLHAWRCRGTLAP
jgi:hypothetical protein